LWERKKIERKKYKIFKLNNEEMVHVRFRKQYVMDACPCHTQLAIRAYRVEGALESVLVGVNGKEQNIFGCPAEPNPLNRGSFLYPSPYPYRAVQLISTSIMQRRLDLDGTVQ
jgi:hypothetical protein